MNDAAVLPTIEYLPEVGSNVKRWGTVFSSFMPNHLLRKAAFELLGVSFTVEASSARWFKDDRHRLAKYCLTMEKLGSLPVMVSEGLTLMWGAM